MIYLYLQFLQVVVQAILFKINTFGEEAFFVRIGKYHQRLHRWTNITTYCHFCTNCIEN